MKRALLALFVAAIPAAALAQPALRIEIVGPAEDAIPGGWPRCDRDDIPDAPARAIRLADGTVQLYASDQVDRINPGPDLAHLRHDCAVVMMGAHADDPAAFDDRAWIASPWTADGRTIWAVVHDEFHGDQRPALCPTRRYMDCWYNALTLAVSRDAGRHFRPAPAHRLVATIPYRYDQVGRGHHGYFNPSNILAADGGLVMFAFATAAGAQREGNCLLRTDAIDRPWTAWDGAAFAATFVDPYAGPTDPAAHVCAPVGAGALRWPVTSLVRHAPTGLYVATMQDTAPGGGVFYATSPDLLRWSAPALLQPATGLRAWTCGAPLPIAYPSILDPTSPDRNFQTIGGGAELYETRFDSIACKVAESRNLVRFRLKITTR